MRGPIRVLLVVSALLLSSGLAACSGDDEPAERPRIAILRSVVGDDAEASLLDGLADGGYGRDDVDIVDRDLSVVQADAKAAAATARRAVAGGADVLLAMSTTTALAAAEVTDAVPVVFISNDPLASGLVDDLRSPGKNLTGVAYRVPADRTLALGREVLGNLDAVGCLYGEGDPAVEPPQIDLERGGEALGITVECVGFDGPAGVPGAVAAMTAAGVDAVVVINAPSTVRSYPELARALAETTLPAFSSSPTDFALLTLVPDTEALYRQLGRQAARLLDGVPVADIPVEDPAGYRLEVNAAVARRLQIEVPPSVLERADRVVGADVSDR